MKKGQRLLGMILGLMIGISLLTVSVLAAMDAATASVAHEAPVLYASGDTTNATPTPDPAPTATASTGTTRPTPTPEPTVTTPQNYPLNARGGNFAIQNLKRNTTFPLERQKGT